MCGSSYAIHGRLCVVASMFYSWSLVYGGPSVIHGRLCVVAPMQFMVACVQWLVCFIHGLLCMVAHVSFRDIPWRSHITYQTAKNRFKNAKKWIIVTKIVNLCLKNA